MEKILQDLWSSLIQLATTLGLRLVFAAIIIVVGLKLTKWIVKKLPHTRAMRRADLSLVHFLSSLTKIALNTLVFVTAAMVLGVPTASFVTVLGSAGLALGLALQGSLSNFAGSIMILMFKPFKIGDYIKTSSYEGTVVDINFFYTVLKTMDGKQVTLPNGNLSNNNIENFYANGARRIDFVFSASYNSDIEKVKQILLEVANGNSLVEKSPAPLAAVVRHSQSSLDFAVQVWVKQDNYWTVYYEMFEQVRIKFAENGIEIPFPQVDVHMK